MANFADSFLRGQAIGSEMRDRREERDRQASLRTLYSDYYNAPEGQRPGLGQFAAVSPEAAVQLEGRQRQERVDYAAELPNRAKLLLSLPSEQRAVAWQRMAPDVARMLNMPELAQIPYDDAAFPQVLQQFAAMGGADSDLPASVREAMAFRADPSLLDIRRQMYNNFSWGEVENADGTKSWVPRGSRTGAIGGPGNVTVGQPQPAAFAGSGGDPKADSIMQAANAMVAAGVPPQEIEAWMQRTMQQAGMQPTAGGQMPPQAAPAPVGGGMPAPGYGGGAPAPAPGGVGYGATNEDRARAEASAAEQKVRAEETARRMIAQDFARPEAEAEADAARRKRLAELEAERIDAQRGQDRTYSLYETASTGLRNALAGTTTGPLAGRMPAVTAGQQIADGGVAAMAPVLKQLFRSAGEGVFTDKDQELLMRMLPTRTDHPEAARAKLEMIDSIVQAKLGISGQPSADSGIDDIVSKWAD